MIFKVVAKVVVKVVAKVIPEMFNMMNYTKITLAEDKH